MNRLEVIKLLENENWTKADAIRALELVDFNTNPDELAIRRAISPFAGSELNKRQRLQAAQKGMATKKSKEIERQDKEYAAKLDQWEKVRKQEKEKGEAEIQSLFFNNEVLETKIESLASSNNVLVEANEELKKDNKTLKNLVDEIKLKLAMNTQKLLQYEDSEIRRELVRLFKWTLG